MLETKSGKPALIAALKIAEGDLLDEGQQELFELMKQAEESQDIEANVAEFEGVKIHRITPKNLEKMPKICLARNR